MTTCLWCTYRTTHWTNTNMMTLTLCVFVSLTLLPLTTCTTSSSRHFRWAEQAFGFIQALNCEEVFFTTDRECRELQRMAKDGINVWIASAAETDLDADALEEEPSGSSAQGRLVATLPDGSLNRGEPHDAVLVIDPFPEADFGHLVVVFFLDFQMPQLECKVNGGTTLDGGDECMTLALRNRCLNILEKRNRRRNLARRCEINFLPLVHREIPQQSPAPFDQRLTCRNLSGFGPCPELRAKNETSRIMCNPLDVNTQRCQTTHETVNTRCRILEVCDHAVLLASGWNREHSVGRHALNLRAMYLMLSESGFSKDNIKTFYANGGYGHQVLGDDSASIYPSAMKLALRHHIRKLCQMTHCADSLVIYLNNPTQSDGTMLLWDADGNGEMDATEIYTSREFLTDLRECEARQVIIIADQSFSGDLVKAFVRSNRHRNVKVFASGREGEYSWDSQLTAHWTNFRHTHTCVDDVYQASKSAVRKSTPTMHDGSNGDIRTTIFGAPCDVKPPFTKHELERRFYGCQNLPTKVWLSKFAPS